MPMQDPDLAWGEVRRAALAFAVADGDPVAERVRIVHPDQLSYIEDVVAVAAEAVGLVDLVPDRLELTVAVEDLNAVVLAVGHEHVLVLIDDDIVGVHWAAERRLKQSGTRADLSQIKTVGDYVEFFCRLHKVKVSVLSIDNSR